MVKTYDLIIIGGGTGGLRLAVRAGAKGAKVALFEPGLIGGTCLNNGCIPTKAMLEAAHRYEQIKELREFGLQVTGKSVNIRGVMQRVNDIVRTGVEHIVDGLEHNKQVDWIKEEASFVDKLTVKAGGQTYKAEAIVIATGASNFTPPIPGLQDINYYTNENILGMRTLPKSLAMIGCGYISMEFATFFRSLGTKVTMLESFPQALGFLDDDVAKTLLEEYTHKGITIKTGVTITKARYNREKGKYGVLYTENGEEKRAQVDAVFVATGRRPNTGKLNLAAAGIKTDSHGGIIVDEKLCTNVKGVYAMGDCIGHDLFAHAVKREAEIILHNLEFPKKQRSMDFSLMPWVVFTDPNVAGIGLSEKRCKEKKIKYEVAKVEMRKAGRTKIINDQRGFVKVLFDPKTRKLLGATIIGAHADDLIHEIVALMYCDATIDKLREIIHVHPTVSEVFGEI